MYIPNEWYDEFEEYKKDQFYGNEGIYDNFDEEQFDAVKGYFRWRTKKRFRELVANTTLEVKPKKAQTLSALMGNATDWIYDGCVDTGFVGASHCELGHALRYEHYALSPSTGRQIVFGVNCASDFFGIEPEKLRKINSVQDEILEEIKFIAFVQNTGKQPIYVKKFYGDLMDVIKVLRVEMNESFGADWNQQMANFLNASLPWTKSMVQKFEYVHRYIYQDRLRDYKKTHELEELCGNDPKAIELIKSGAVTKNIHIIKVITTSVIKRDAGIDDKRRQALIRLAVKFDETYTNLSKLGVSDFNKFVNSVKEDVYYVKTANGERLATKGEVEAKVNKIFIKEEIYLPENQYKMLRLFGWAIFGTEKMYNESGCAESESDLDKVIKSGKLMADTLDWLNNLEELKLAIMSLKDHMNAREYPDTAIDEIKTEISIKEIIDYLSNTKVDKKMKNKTVEIALNIAEKAVYYNNYDVSVRQAKVLRDAYRILTGTVLIDGNIESDDVELFKKIDMLSKNKNNPLLDRYQFNIDVMGTVVKYGKASPKQKKLIDEAYGALESGSTNSDASPFIDNEDEAIVDDSQGKENSNVAELFIDNEESEDIDEIDNDSEDDSSVFVDDKNNYKKKNTWKTSANSIVKMPTISEISQALGAGFLKEDIEGDEQ